MNSFVPTVSIVLTPAFGFVLKPLKIGGCQSVVLPVVRSTCAISRSACLLLWLNVPPYHSLSAAASIVNTVPDVCVLLSAVIAPVVGFRPTMPRTFPPPMFLKAPPAYSVLPFGERSRS